MAFIIAVSGCKQSGKNTSADYVTARLAEEGKTSRVFAFADPMKRMCMQFFGLTHEQCWGTDEQKNTPTALLWENFPVHIQGKSGYMTARDVLQFFGTEILRHMYDPAHVRATFYEIEHSGVDVALIADARFPNEVDAVLERGKVIRLERVVFPNDNHASERSLDRDVYDWSNFSAIIPNQDMTITEQNSCISNYLLEWGVIMNRFETNAHIKYTVVTPRTLFEVSGRIVEQVSPQTYLVKRDHHITANVGMYELDVVPEENIDGLV